MYVFIWSSHQNYMSCIPIMYYSNNQNIGRKYVLDALEESF